MPQYNNIKFETCQQVYAPAEDTFLLADNLLVHKGDVVLEIGTGTGLVALSASKLASKVVATDINPHAIKCAQANTLLNGVNNMDIHQGDLFQPVLGEKFDLILFNTPYLPSAEDEIIGDELDAAWDGGPDGRRVIDLFLNEVRNYLNDKGIVQLVQSSLSDNKKTCQKLESMGFKVEITDSERFFFEEIVVISGFLKE
jgi:release factor glutamine methyltransferase